MKSLLVFVVYLPFAQSLTLASAAVFASLASRASLSSPRLHSLMKDRKCVAVATFSGEEERETDKKAAERFVAI